MPPPVNQVMKKSEKKTSERATRVRAAKTPVKTIKRWLRVIARGGKAPGYATGTKLFLNAWHKKTPAEIKRLCEQIKEVTLRDDVLSQTEFGKGATEFFRGLDLEQVNWQGVAEKDALHKKH